MKKLLVMVMLLCSMCAVCFAKLEQPTDDRWVIIGPRSEGLEVWFDIESIKFGKSTEIGHGDHNAARVWCQFNLYDEERYIVLLNEYDFDCSTMRRLSMAVYDSTRNCLASDFKHEIYGNPVIPGTNSEYYLQFFEDMYNMKKILRDILNVKNLQKY